MNHKLDDDSSDNDDYLAFEKLNTNYICNNCNNYLFTIIHKIHRDTY